VHKIYEGTLSFVAFTCFTYMDSPHKRECGGENGRIPSSRQAASTLYAHPARYPPTSESAIRRRPALSTFGVKTPRTAPLERATAEYCKSGSNHRLLSRRAAAAAPLCGPPQPRPDPAAGCWIGCSGIYSPVAAVYIAAVQAVYTAIYARMLYIPAI
jgi:hypothetical protein